MQCCTDFLPAIYIGLANFINFILFQGTFTLIIEAWHDTNETSSRSPGKYSRKTFFLNLYLRINSLIQLPILPTIKTKQFKPTAQFLVNRRSKIIFTG